MNFLEVLHTDATLDLVELVEDLKLLVESDFLRFHSEQYLNVAMIDFSVYLALVVSHVGFVYDGELLCLVVYMHYMIEAVALSWTETDWLTDGLTDWLRPAEVRWIYIFRTFTGRTILNLKRNNCILLANILKRWNFIEVEISFVEHDISHLNVS